MQARLEHILRTLRLLEVLTPFDPRVIGTIPLGVCLPQSDVDIACEAHDLAAFIRHVTETFGHLSDFSAQETQVRGTPAAVVGFRCDLWVELFAQPLSVEQQHGYRHFQIEARLLELLGAPLQRAVMRRRTAGLKTEPAFAAALGLSDKDPYLGLLRLEAYSDRALAEWPIVP